MHLHDLRASDRTLHELISDFGPNMRTLQHGLSTRSDAESLIDSALRSLTLPEFARLALKGPNALARMRSSSTDMYRSHDRIHDGDGDTDTDTDTLIVFTCEQRAEGTVEYAEGPRDHLTHSIATRYIWKRALDHFMGARTPGGKDWLDVFTAAAVNVDLDSGVDVEARAEVLAILRDRGEML